MPSRKTDLKTLKKLITEARDILLTTKLPEGRSERAYELLNAAVRLADDLDGVNPAATLGSQGGKQTAKRGADYFRKIASMRKERKGGRPKKQTVN